MFTFDTGPFGNHLSVDASGRVIATNDPVGGLYPFRVGNTGRICVVDASGRLVISPESNDDILPGTKGSPVTRITASGNTNVDLSVGNVFRVGLLANATFTFAGVEEAKYTFLFNQEVGSADVTWPGNVIWRGGNVPTLTAASGARDVVSLLYESSDDVYYGDYGLDFS